MVYSINASLYYSTISMLFASPIFSEFHNYNRKKKPNFKGLFDVFHNFLKIQNFAQDFKVILLKIIKKNSNNYIIYIINKIQ